MLANKINKLFNVSLCGSRSWAPDNWSEWTLNISAQRNGGQRLDQFHHSKCTSTVVLFNFVTWTTINIFVIFLCTKRSAFHSYFCKWKTRFYFNFVGNLREIKGQHFVVVIKIEKLHFHFASNASEEWKMNEGINKLLMNWYSCSGWAETDLIWIQFTTSESVRAHSGRDDCNTSSSPLSYSKVVSIKRTNCPVWVKCCTQLSLTQ